MSGKPLRGAKIACRIERTRRSPKGDPRECGKRPEASSAGSPGSSLGAGVRQEASLDLAT